LYGFVLCCYRFSAKGRSINLLKRQEGENDRRRREIKSPRNNMERNCADTIGTVWFPGLAVEQLFSSPSNREKKQIKEYTINTKNTSSLSSVSCVVYRMLKYKYTEAIFTTSTRKQLWFEITKMLNAV